MERFDEPQGTKVGEDWARQFKKDQVPEDVEGIPIKFEDILTIPISEIEWSISEGLERPVLGRSYQGVKMDRLLVKCGLAESSSDAVRKIKQGAVRVGSNVHEGIYFLVEALPIRLQLRVGKQLRVVVIHR